MTYRVVALVPMRHDSERVPGKNYRLLDGLPLFHHITETLLQVPEIAEVLIDTDSDVVAREVRDSFPDRVRVVARPEHLRAGETAMNDVLLNTIEHSSADWYLQTHCTNPLLQAETIARALQELWANPGKDSLFSVSRLQTRLWWSADRPVNHDPAVLRRTQDLPPIYEENSNIYVFSADSLRCTKNRIGRSPLMFEIDAAEAFDIDDELDFIIAEVLKTHRRAAS